MVLYIIIIYIDIMNLTTIHLSAIINQYYIINHSSFPISPPLQFLRALLLLRELPLGGQVLLRSGRLVLVPKRRASQGKNRGKKRGKTWEKCGENVEKTCRTREKL
jgi:hypothetical protein